jgi:hypothetical protein
MKKVVYFLVVVVLSFLPLLSSAANTEKPSTDLTKPAKVETRGLLKNFDSFNKVDKSTLVANDKKSSAVVRSSERHRHNGGVIYISAGTLLVIILIILLI